MPRLTDRVPKYRRHKPSRQAVVTIHGRDYCLGRWRSSEGEKEYSRVIGEYLTRDRQPPPAGPGELTIVELLAACW